MTYTKLVTRIFQSSQNITDENSGGQALQINLNITMQEISFTL